MAPHMLPASTPHVPNIVCDLTTKLLPNAWH